MKQYNKRVSHRWMLLLVCCAAGLLLPRHPLCAADIVYPAHDAERTGGAVQFPDPAANGGLAVSGLSLTSAVLTFHDVDGGAGGLAKLIISYANRGEDSVTTKLLVNGKSTTIDLPLTEDLPTGYKTITQQIMLQEGKNNTITFKSTGQNWLCDSITVHAVLNIPSSRALNALLPKVPPVIVDFWPYYFFLLTLMVASVLVKKECDDIALQHAQKGKRRR